MSLEKTYSYQVSVDSKLQAIQIIGQRKTFYKQRSPESNFAWKETVDIDILITSRNGGKKNQVIYQNNKQTSLERKEVKPVQPIYMNNYQSNTYRKDMS